MSNTAVLRDAHNGRLGVSGPSSTGRLTRTRASNANVTKPVWMHRALPTYLFLNECAGMAKHVRIIFREVNSFPTFNTDDRRSLGDAQKRLILAWRMGNTN